MTEVLRLEGLDAGYGDAQVLFEVGLRVAEGEAVALIGANGAGKSTLLRSICGLLQPRAGRLHFCGQDLSACSVEQIARAGVALVPEGRMLFASLTVEENLLMGAESGRSGPWDLRRVYGLFPVLKERRAQLPARLSGGQQQMVAIGRALMSNPRLLLCDELSLGLAPIVIEQIYQSFASIRDEGLALLLVEQDVRRACRETERLYCLLKGRITLEGASHAFDADTIAKAYFG